MDASYKIQRGIHVHLIQFFMCPEFWVHIIDDNDQLRLKPALLECENLSIRREAEQVQYNSPEIYLVS